MKARTRNKRVQRRRNNLFLERLERRELLAADVGFLHNPADAMDVNDDGVVAPLDALMVVNELNAAAARGPNGAGEPTPVGRGFFDVNADQQVSPLDALDVVNRLNRGENRDGPRDGDRPRPPAPGPDDFRTLDGTENNLENPDWGSSEEQLLRFSPAEYEDGISELAGADRPSARVISNAIADQEESIVNDRHLSNILYVWGQFIDHDIDLTTSADPEEAISIPVPQGDPFFDPTGTGTATIDTKRSIFDTDTGDAVDDPRQQLNMITSFLDGSVVYGSDSEVADSLRTFAGGQMLTSDGDLLPLDPATGNMFFLAGDIRVNDNVVLMAMQAMWVREHNRIAGEIAAEDPSLSDEQIYQQARAIVGAEIQAITYNEYLPALLGVDAIRPYDGYDASVNPGVSTEFSTAAYRFGHSMLSTEVPRLNDDGTVIDDGNLSLRDAFFLAVPEIVEHGIDSVLMGAISHQAQEIDTQIVDDVRNFLFGAPGAGGLDLAALNITRGRDHGLADYNSVREAYGLPRVEGFDEITSDPALQASLAEMYGDVDNIDLWVGGLAEDHVPGSSIGLTFQRIMVDQFTRLRDGDRYWYQNVFSGDQLRELENTTLGDVILRNTELTNVQENVFFDPSVLTFQAGRGSVDLAVVAGPETVELIDHRSGEVLESRPLDEVSQVLVTGSGGEDRVLVDVSRAAGGIEDGIVVNGRRGLDEVIVRGTPEADSVQVSRGGVTVNGDTIRLNRVESLALEIGPGEDDVQVAGRLGFRVSVDGQDLPNGPEQSPPPTPVELAVGDELPGAPPAGDPAPLPVGGGDTDPTPPPPGNDAGRPRPEPRLADAGRDAGNLNALNVAGLDELARNRDRSRDGRDELALDQAFADFGLGNPL